MRPLTALFAAGAGLTLLSQKEAREERKELREALNQERNETSDDDINVTVSDPSKELELEQSNSLERLVDIRERNEPTPESRDASQSGTFELDPGQKAVIEAQPENGYILQVERAYVDRRDDHRYEISIDGVNVSETHEWTGNPPRRVSENGKVVIEVTNVSASTSVQDFVMDMYGMESEVAP